MGVSTVCMVMPWGSFLLCMMTKNKFRILIDLKNSLHIYREKQYIKKEKVKVFLVFFTKNPGVVEGIHLHSTDVIEISTPTLKINNLS